MTTAAGSARPRSRIVLGAVACIGLVLLALYLLRGPLLLEQIRAAITAKLAQTLDADVQCARISGDPMGRVVLHDLAIDGAARGIDVQRAQLTLDLNAFAWSRGDEFDTVERFELRVPEAKILASAPDEKPKSELVAPAQAPRSQVSMWVELFQAARAGIVVDVASLHIPGVEDGVPVQLEWDALGDDGQRSGRLRVGESRVGLHARADSFRIEAKDFEVGGIEGLRIARGELELSSFELGKTWTKSRLRGIARLEDTSWNGVRLDRVEATVNWQNAELELRKLDAQGLREEGCTIGCDAHGKIRLDLPRGAARRVARIHWNLAGNASPSAISASAGFCPPTPASRFTSHGSVKLPISYGAAEEYVAGTMNLEMKAVHPPGFSSPLHLRIHADIDGLGLLIFRRVWIRQDGKEAIRIVGRYPLHRYGRPDLRLAVSIDDLQPWLRTWGQGARDTKRLLARSRSLHGEIKVRGAKTKPYVNARVRAQVPVELALVPIQERTSRRFFGSHDLSRAALELSCEAKGSLTSPALRITGSSQQLDFFGLGSAPFGILPGMRWQDPIATWKTYEHGFPVFARWKPREQSEVALRATLQAGQIDVHALHVPALR